MTTRARVIASAEGASAGSGPRSSLVLSSSGGRGSERSNGRAGTTFDAALSSRHESKRRVETGKAGPEG